LNQTVRTGPESSISIVSNFMLGRLLELEAF